MGLSKKSVELRIDGSKRYISLYREQYVASAWPDFHGTTTKIKDFIELTFKGFLASLSGCKCEQSYLFKGMINSNLTITVAETKPFPREEGSVGINLRSILNAPPSKVTFKQQKLDSMWLRLKVLHFLEHLYQARVPLICARDFWISMQFALFCEDAEHKLLLNNPNWWAFALDYGRPLKANMDAIAEFRKGNVPWNKKGWPDSKPLTEKQLQYLISNVGPKSSN
jgi:hypothetical protein